MPEKNQAKSSPLIWAIIAIIGLLMVVIFFSGRSNTSTEKISLSSEPKKPVFSGEIERKPPSAPGIAARELIRAEREKGKPYALDKLHEIALEYRVSGSLADAHLLFFFAAREGHLPSIITMGEMSDPILYSEETSLLDTADPIQSYKWYKIAANRDHIAAKLKLLALHKWAQNQPDDSAAQQLLLNFEE